MRRVYNRNFHRDNNNLFINWLILNFKQLKKLILK
jgi:hypothetical protein